MCGADGPGASGSPRKPYRPRLTPRRVRAARSRGRCCSRWRRPVQPRAKSGRSPVTPPPRSDERASGTWIHSARHSSPVLYVPKRSAPTEWGPSAQSSQKATPVGAMVGVNQRRGRIGFGPSRFVSEGDVADPQSAAGPQPLVPPAHDPIQLVVALRAVLGLPQVAGNRIEPQAERVADARGPHAPIRTGSPARPRHPLSTGGSSSRRRELLGGSRVARIADRDVAYALVDRR